MKFQKFVIFSFLVTINTVFPLISVPGAYQILKLLDAALIRGRHLFQS